MTVTGEFCALDKKSMVEPRALYLISSGIYIVGSKKDDRYNGQIASSISQVSSDPPRIILSINKESLTHEYIQESKVFSISVLSRDTPRKFIMTLGFRSGRSFDKLKDVNYKIGTSGAPIVMDNALAYMDCQVTGSFDCETHTAFVAKVIDAELLKTEKPMSYAYYCEVLKGKTPASSPSYLCAC